MNKSRLRAIKWLAGGVRDALRHPISDRAARLNVAVWSALLTVVVLNLTMALLVGVVSGFTIGFTVVGLALYVVCLRYAMEGLAYRRSQQRIFDEIVGNS